MRRILQGISLALSFTALLSMEARAEAPAPAASPQSSLSAYRSPLEARVTDRRFVTRDAMFLANEMGFGGDPFFKAAHRAGLPVAEDRDFFYMTAVESYWYSRYNMSALVTESRLGVHVVHGPYVAERAIREGRALDNRARGEYVLSNKTELIQRLVGDYLHMTGFPRRFEDASPSMLQYASGDPELPRRLDKGTDFESPENLERWKELSRYYPSYEEAMPRGVGQGGNDLWKYRINYRENFLTLRWDNDKMDHAVDLGAEGQTLLKEVQWMEYFFQSHHHDGHYLGNNPEEGFRGAMLNLMAVSKMLALKGCLVYDGHRLGGLDPVGYDPAAGLRYFPHRVKVRSRYVGDLPARPEEFLVDDASSQLMDQASLLWGLTEYYRFADPVAPDTASQVDVYDDGAVHRNWARVFGQDPPYDGSLMERKYGLLAQALADLVLANIEAMHTRDGHLVSEWTPTGHGGGVIRTEDAAMAMLALANYHKRMQVEPERRARAGELLRGEADFLLSHLRNKDGSFVDGYDFAAQRALGGAPSLLAQGMAIRALVKAAKELVEPRYLEAARGAYAFMNEVLWDQATGVYRSSLGATKSVYTPFVLGAALGAVREMILATRETSELARFKRFWVQAVDNSGIQQSEYEETGERDFTRCDGDGDGIPRIECAGGRHGIAPVFAERVEIATPIDRRSAERADAVK